MLRNEGAGARGLRFTDVAMAVGADSIYDSRGVAAADFDGDGDLDLAINANPGDGAAHRARAVLYRNDLADDLASIRFELEGTASNREGVGARVSVRVGDRWQTRQREAGSGFASQHSARLHFGVRDVDAVDEVVVVWPSGTVDRHGPLATGARYRLLEGGAPEPLASLPPARLGGP